MFAVRQSEGKTAVSNDRWKMSVSARTRGSSQFFKMTLGIWSGPHALWGLVTSSNLHTPAVLMLVSNDRWKMSLSAGARVSSVLQNDIGDLVRPARFVGIGDFE